MHAGKLVLAALFAAALPAIAQAGEINGKSTFYWSFTMTTLGANQAAGYAMGRSVGPRINADGTAFATDCRELITPTGNHGVCVHHVTPQDSFTVEYTCTGPINALPAGAFFGCNGKAEGKGGTGKFTGLKGTETFVVYGTGMMPDGTLVGYAEADSDFTY